MLMLSNLHGLRQRLNNRLQMYKTFFEFPKQFIIKSLENQIILSVINLKFMNLFKF